MILSGLLVFLDETVGFETGGGNDWDLALRSFLLVLFCVALFVFTYFITKYISRARISGNNHGNIFVAEVISVGIGATVQLIKAGNKYILIGVTKERIVFLTEVSPEDIKTPEQISVIGKGLFDKYLNKFINKDKNTDIKDDDGDDSED